MSEYKKLTQEQIDLLVSRGCRAEDWGTVGFNCNFKKKAAEAFTSCDVELQYGGQPIYYYILSAE